ncbi:MAG: glycosyltransferase family 2 protein [Eisenbergiella massiliensis]
MTTFLYWLIIVAVVLSFLTMGIYYIWISVIAFFPKIQRHKETPYSEEIDMHFFIVIPCLNEEAVIVEAIENVLNLKMKNTQLIVVDDDSEDDTVKNIYAAFGDFVTTVNNDSVFDVDCPDKPVLLLQKRLPEARQGKGKSLNCAYHLIDAIIKREGLDPACCVMSVIDADTYINRRVFERVAVILNEEPAVGMVQARVRIGTFTRDNFLPLFQDIEFFTYINNMQNVREYTGTVSAAGNGQFNRFCAIDPEEPWTECLLEDFDFSLRLLLKGWRTRLLQEDRVFQQGVLTYRAFVKQRSRWCQGGIQCMRYWGDIRKSRFLSSYGKIELIYFMLLPTVTVLSVFTQLLSWIVIFWYFVTDSSILPKLFAPYPEWELTVVLCIILFFVFMPGISYCLFYRADTKENLITCILAGLFQPVYNLLQIPAVFLAVGRQLIGRKSWIKTAHFHEKRKKKREKKNGSEDDKDVGTAEKHTSDSL